MFMLLELLSINNMDLTFMPSKLGISMLNSTSSVKKEKQISNDMI